MRKKKDSYEEVIIYIVENQDNFYRLAFSYVRDKEDALDIVQNAICKALENYGGLKDLGALRTWFYRILVNESVSYIRRHGKEIQCEEAGKLMEEKQAEEFLTGNGTIEITGIEAEVRESIYREIEGMPLDLQHIIKLHYFEDMTLKEVAKVLELNLNSVKAKLYRGLKKMKIHMEENEIWEK